MTLFRMFISSAIAFPLLLSCGSHSDGDNRSYWDSIANASKKKVIGYKDTSAIAYDSTWRPKNSKWDYESQADKMTSDTGRVALLYSDNIIDFDFPYSGGSYGLIIVRKKRGRLDIGLRITKGQFSGNYDNPTVLIKFDNSTAVRWSYTEAANGSSDVIFLDNEKALLAKLKKAKKVLIEATFYDAGSKVMEFSTQGLEWRY